MWAGYSISIIQNEASIELLGEPIKEGWWVMGNMEVSGHTGQADISFPVYGSKSEGRVYVKAFKDMDKWEFERIVVKTKEGTSLDLTP